MPHPWANRGRYDGAEYNLDHMAYLVREIACSDGQVRPVEFRFCYHCFTETEKATDFRTRFTDPEFPYDKPRVFCPHRWFLSHRLREFLRGEIDTQRLFPEPGYQWRWRKTLAGISAPYLVHLKLAVPIGRGPIIVNVNSAYVATMPTSRGSDSGQRFDSLLTYVATQRKIPGNP